MLRIWDKRNTILGQIAYSLYFHEIFAKKVRVKFRNFINCAVPTVWKLLRFSPTRFQSVETQSGKVKNLLSLKTYLFRQIISLVIS